MFLAMLRQHIFYVEWVQFRKMREFFRAKLCCKMTDLFCYYLWLWDFLPENLKLVDKLQLWGFSLFIFWYKFRFLRSAKNLFNFKIFRCRPTMVAYILTQPSVIIVNSWKPLTIITKSSMLDVAAVVDPPVRWSRNKPFWFQDHGISRCLMW